MSMSQMTPSSSSKWPGVMNGAADQDLLSVVASLKAPLSVDAGGSVTNADGAFVPMPNLLSIRLVVHLGNELEVSRQEAQKVRRFMAELLDSVESLTAVAEEHGPRTLADLFYLHAAIGSGGFVDFYPGESRLVEMVEGLPSAAEWLQFIKQESRLDESVVRQADRLFVRAYHSGIVYADWADNSSGEYARVGFLPYDTLKLELNATCPEELRGRIEAHASEMQGKRGEKFEIKPGQYVTLGGQA